MKISTLTIEMAANVARLRQDMDKARRTVDSAMGGITKAVGLATAAFSALGIGVAGVNFTQWIRGAINAADEASKLAQKTGLLVEQVAGLQLAFDQAGAGDQLKGALARLSKEAAAGNVAFTAMGITLRKQDGTLLSTRELIGEVADRFSSYRDSAEKTALAQELFGKAGADLIPLLNAGAASLADYDAKAKALGITLDEEAAKAAEKFNDEMDLLMRRADGVAVALSGPIVEALNKLIDRFNEGSKAGESFLSVALKAYTQNVKDFYGVNDYADTRKELERINTSLASGKLNTMQTLAFEEKRAELAKTMAGYLKSQAGAGRGSVNPDMLSLQGSGTAPVVPRGGGSGGGRSGGASGAAATISEFDRLSQQLSGRVASAWADAQASAMGYNQAQEEFLRLAASPQWAALTGEQRAQLAVLSEKLILQQQEAVAMQQLARVQEEARASYAASLQASTQGADAAARRVLEMQQEAEALTLAEQRQIGLAEAVELTAIARLRERQAAAMGDEAMVLAIQREIDAREKLVSMLGDRRIQEAAQKSAEAASVEWEKVTTKIEDMLTDALMRGFESGKGFGENLGDSLVNLFKTFVAREIASAITQAMLAAFAKTQFASALGGGGGGNSGLFMQAVSAYFGTQGGGGGGGGGTGIIGLAMQAYKAYTTYAATAITVATEAQAAAASAALSAELAAAEAAAAASSTAARTGAAAGSSAAASSGGLSSLGATGWGAIIVAAIVAGNNLYRAGYNRAALSSSVDSQRVGSYSTSGQSGGRSSVYDSSFERYKRSMLEAIGVNEQWSDILSGTTRMAALFGRKLAFAGLNVDVNGGNTNVRGVEQYRGGLFRSDKTREFAVDSRDQKMVQDLVSQTRAAAIETARAAGLSTEAIENWNGQIRINFKGVKTAAEETERYNKALNKAYTQMIKAAQQATFDANIQKQVEGVRESARTMAAALGLSTENINSFAGSLNVSMKEMDGSEGAARKLAKASEDLYYQMLQSTAGFDMTRGEFQKFLDGVTQSAEAVGISAKGIADVLVQGMTGRLSGADVGNQLASTIVGGIYTAIAQNYANTIAQAFTSQIITPIFTAIASGVPISQAISQQAIANVVATAQAAAAQLNAIFSNAEFQNAIRQIGTAIQGVTTAAVSTSGSVRGLGSSAGVASSQVSRAASQIKQEWKSIADSIVDEIKRIRGELAEEGGRGYSYYAAQFATTTARARAGDRKAAASLPELSRSMLEAAESSVATLAELQRLQALTAQSLQDTAQGISRRYKIKLPSFAVGTDYVPSDMLAMIHKGERITPAPFNPASSPESGLAERFDALSARFDKVATLLTDIEGNTDEAARVLKSVARGDQAFKTTT